MPFAVYKASAGSGKTYALVKEYLRIILTDPRDFSHILAITFTNKVANEMKERVLLSLEELSADKDSQSKKTRTILLPDLVKSTRLSDSQIGIKAREALTLILHNYSDFAIGTMDSFSHRLIRAFAHDFGLPINFNVELDAEELLTTAVDLLLNRVGEDEDLTQLLVRFLETRMDEERGWNIDEILVSFAHNLLDEEGQLRLGTIKDLTLPDYQKITELIHARIRHFERIVKEKAEKAYRLICSKGIPESAFFQSEKGIAGYFRNISRGKIDRLNPNSYVTDTIENDKWYSKKISGEHRALIDEVKGQLRAYFEDIAAEREQNQSSYTLHRLLLKTIYPLAVLNEINRVLDEFKRQNNLVHISEFNTRIARIILNEPVPFIYERLGEKYRHVLIDEFQDTSALQWMNFIPLIENGLASGYFSLVVGDGKQAIYRWRNGDVEQFASLPEIPMSADNPVLMQRQTALQNHYLPVTLSSNFRSKAEIVEFNNQLFGFLAQEYLTGDFAGIYKDHEQKYNPADRGGYVRIEFLERDGQSFENEQTLIKVLDLVRGLVEEKYRLSDIAVLCRNNVNASEVARVLLLNNINVVSAESLLLRSSPAVNFLTSFMSFLSGPFNPVTEAEIASFLLSRGHPDGITLNKVLQRIATGRGTMKNLFAELGYSVDLLSLSELPVYDLCEELLRSFGLLGTPDPYILFFLDAVHQFATTNTPGTKDFLSWWERRKEKLSIVVPGGVDAVRVMTIHKAKGLQFPVVIFPYANESLRMTKKFMWVDVPEEEHLGLTLALLQTEAGMRDTQFHKIYETEESKSLLDLLNILYVAMTRPEERLYILTKEPPDSGKQQSIPSWLSSFLKHEGSWNDDKKVYDFGDPVPHIPHKGDEIDTVQMTTMISSDWRKRVHIRMRAPEIWDMDGENEPSQWGNRIHMLLAKVTTRDDVGDVIEEAMLSGLVLPEEKEQLDHVFATLFAMPFVARLFSDEVNVLSEAEILLPNGEFCRPDRVVTDADDTFIIDYKTGRQHERHKTQLNRYAGYLEEMGYRNITKVLIYLDAKPIVVKF